MAFLTLDLRKKKIYSKKNTDSLIIWKLLKNTSILFYSINIYLQKHILLVQKSIYSSSSLQLSKGSKPSLIVYCDPWKLYPQVNNIYRNIMELLVVYLKVEVVTAFAICSRPCTFLITRLFILDLLYFRNNWKDGHSVFKKASYIKGKKIKFYFTSNLWQAMYSKCSKSCPKSKRKFIWLPPLNM